MTPKASADSTPHLVAGIVPDVTGLDRVFDYAVSEEMAASVGIGGRVRVSLNGRHVGGWIVSLEPPSDDGLKLKFIERSSGLGPDEETLDLCRWASWRWGANRLRPFLVTASPNTVVNRASPTRRTKVLAEPVSPAATSLLADGGGVLRLPPSDDQMPAVLAAARLGPTLVVCASIDGARVLATRLRRTGVSVALMPDEWAQARGGADVVIGARAAAFAPCPDLASAVVLDEHEDAMQEERVPTWHARDVVIERARRRGAPVLLISPCPSVGALAGRKVVAPPAEREAAAWPLVEVADRNDEEPWKRSLVSAQLIAHLRDPGVRVACVLNTKGQAKLLACRGCNTLVRCEKCDAAMGEDEVGRLDCGSCGATRPRVCASCGSGVLARLRPGVSRLRDELEAAAQRDVVSVVANKDSDVVDDSVADVFVGTEAVLHRVRRIDVVAFLDFDSELLAPRYRAAEQAMALLARAARLLGKRRDGGRLLIQTTMSDHEVVRAALAGSPSVASDAEVARRTALSLPPFSAMASIDGDGVERFTDDLRSRSGISVVAHRDRWLVRATDSTALADALAETERPANSKLRVEVDPPRL
jgi:primosomal protein N' (replication factor Y)